MSGDFTGQPEIALRIGFAVTGDTLGVEDRLDIARVVNHLPSQAVATIFEEVARLWLRNARPAC